MLRLKIIFICIFVAMIGVARAGTYSLKNGQQITGEAISFDDHGIKFKLETGDFSERTPYDQFTQEAIRSLLADAKPHDKPYLEPLIEELPQEKAQKKEINIKPVPSPERPTKSIGIFQIFHSSVGLAILFILYVATLFAAYEVAVFRNQPYGLVIGLAAIPFLGVCSPIIFIAMPTRAVSIEEVHAAHAAPVEAVDPVAEAEAAAEAERAAAAAAEAAAAAASALPEPVVYRRGDFSFNRRFFETKFAGFFRLVPGEAEKDMVLKIKSSRGEFTGKRITKITQDELYLQTFSGAATADEMIPILEIMEAEVRHKDLA